jgi:hypothetical protein
MTALVTSPGESSAVLHLRPLERIPSVVFNLGMGVDSAAILTEYLTNPASRDFALDDMVVITAQTGDEWAETGQLVEEHLLPLLREHNVRFVEVARSQRKTTKDGDGVVVLQDTRQPERVHLDGVFKLSDEMLQAGTIPQSGGARLCSVHAKGDALDPVIAALTQGRPFRQVIGFEANEMRRAVKDEGYNTDLRTGVYPLREWGWDREHCETYLVVKHDVEWSKSACTFCPFALQNKASRERTLRRFGREPQRGVLALYMEHLALALNETQGLVGGKRLRDLVEADDSLAHVLDALEERLSGAEHALYEVRRVIRPGNASRSVRRLRTGSREQLTRGFAQVADNARAQGVKVETAPSGHTRVWLVERDERPTTVEHFLVVAPADCHDKQQPNFEQWFAVAAEEVAA